MSGLLEGKRILVTGVITDASIAFHVAKAAQEAGATVVLTGFGRLSLVKRVAKRLPAEAPVIELDVQDQGHLDALADPWVDQLREVYADLDREVWVLDVTSDLEVPAMVALSRRRRGPLEAIGLGFGAHMDPGVAVRRALTELNQMMPAIATADSVEKIGVADDPDAVGWFRSATVADHPYLLPDPAVRPRRPDDYASDSGSDLAEDVHTVRRRLAALGMDVLVLDQTRPDIGLPAVKVVVPGLRHFWSRYGPGRLYDVPVRLGRLAAPTPYEQLNPTPLFL